MSIVIIYEQTRLKMGSGFNDSMQSELIHTVLLASGGHRAAPAMAVITSMFE